MIITTTVTIATTLVITTATEVVVMAVNLIGHPPEHNTGANSHVTPDLEAMDTSEAYYGDDTLRVRNSKGLHILLIGSSKHSSRRPKIRNDNDIFFEFHTFYFVVKDESTYTTLLTGPKKTRSLHHHSSSTEVNQQSIFFG
ncbi:hypothetical protein Tco_1296198 [Tanacetum coccineum]